MATCKETKDLTLKLMKKRDFDTKPMRDSVGLGLSDDDVLKKAEKLFHDYKTEGTENSAQQITIVYETSRKLPDEKNSKYLGELASRIINATVFIRKDEKNTTIVKELALEIQLIATYVFCEQIAEYNRTRTADVQEQKSKEENETDKINIWLVLVLVGGAAATAVGIAWWLISRRARRKEALA